MRRAFHFLVALMVVMCALHIGEPAQAHDGEGHPAYSAHDAHADHSHAGEAPDDGDEPGKAAHASHHHCPVAPDLRGEAAGDPALAEASDPFARPTATLLSRSQAPPVEPPLA